MNLHKKIIANFPPLPPQEENMEDLPRINNEEIYCPNCEKVFANKYSKDKHNRSPGTCEREKKKI